MTVDHCVQAILQAQEVIAADPPAKASDEVAKLAYGLRALIERAEREHELVLAVIDMGKVKPGR